MSYAQARCWAAFLAAVTGGAADAGADTLTASDIDSFDTSLGRPTTVSASMDPAASSTSWSGSHTHLASSFRVYLDSSVAEGTVIDLQPFWVQPSSTHTHVHSGQSVSGGSFMVNVPGFTAMWERARNIAFFRFVFESDAAPLAYFDPGEFVIDYARSHSHAMSGGDYAGLIGSRRRRRRMPRR